MVVICVPVLCAPYIMQKPQRKRTIEKKTTFYCSWPFMIGGISHVEWQSVADLYLMKRLLTFLPLLRCLRCGRCWVCLSWCPSRALVTDTTRPGTENIVQQDATRCNQMQPDATRCNQMQPDATRCNQMQPDATNKLCFDGLFHGFCWKRMRSLQFRSTPASQGSFTCLLWSATSPAKTPVDIADWVGRNVVSMTFLSLVRSSVGPCRFSKQRGQGWPVMPQR